MDDRAFAALADPTRRAVFERIAEHRNGRRAGRAAAGQPPRRFAHLKVLKEAGLVTDERAARAASTASTRMGSAPSAAGSTNNGSARSRNFKQIAEQEDDR